MTNSESLRLLRRMEKTRHFRTDEEMKIFSKCWNDFSSANEECLLSLPVIRQLLRCVTDAESGGHGLMEALFSYVSATDKRKFSEAFAEDFIRLMHEAPETLISLTSLLLVDERRDVFVRNVRSKAIAERREIQEFIDDVSNQINAPIDVKLLD